MIKIDIPQEILDASRENWSYSILLDPEDRTIYATTNHGDVTRLSVMRGTELQWVIPDNTVATVLIEYINDNTKKFEEICDMYICSDDEGFGTWSDPAYKSEDLTDQITNMVDKMAMDGRSQYLSAEDITEYIALSDLDDRRKMTAAYVADPEATAQYWTKTIAYDLGRPARLTMVRDALDSWEEI